MFTQKRILAVLSLVLVAAFALGACATPTPIEIIKTVEVQVEKQVEKIVTQEVEKIVTKEVEKQVEVVVTKEVEKIVTQEVEVQVDVPSAFATAPFALGDLKVRQALAYCTNKLDLIKTVYPLVAEDQQKALIMNTFIPTSSWAYAGDANITIYPFDAEKGKALLDEAGWTMAEGSEYRANADGIELALKFTTTTAAFRKAWAAVWEQQMKDCGVRIIRLHAPASWWFGDTTGLARRDYELGAFAWVGQADPGGRTLWACDQIPSPENNWEGQNGMGWCNAAADEGIKKAVNSLKLSDRQAAYTVVQAEYTKDVPAIPLFNRTETYAVVAGFQNFKPNAGTSYYQWNAQEWEIPGKDTIIEGFTQEPASLFTLVEDALVAGQAASFISGYSTTDHNFSFQARMLKELSTLDSGLAQMQEVEVKAGDMVRDASGTDAALAAGMKVVNTAGETVEFTGAPVKMNLLVVKYEYVDGLTWSDGEPLKVEDMQLYWKVRCDRENGATSFTICDMIKEIAWGEDYFGYTVTYNPGVMDPTYVLDPLGWYPAHRVLSDGRKLADVPAKEYTTLPEIAENPIGVGPYVLKEWVKGEKMVFEANPYFYLGAPKTPNIVILFITSENAEAQLLGGQVDILDGTSLVGVTETLDAAAKEGKITIIVEPSATWEHIDLNLSFGQ